MESTSTIEQRQTAARLPVGEGAGRQTHPDPEQLERYMHGEASREEARAIVRHLLTGCPDCVAVTRSLWGLAERRPRAVPAGNHEGVGAQHIYDHAKP